MIKINEIQLLDLYQKFELLKHSTKKNEKIKQLTDNKEDELFCFTLEFLLNTDKKTGISTAKLSKEVSNKVSFVTINDFKC